MEITTKWARARAFSSDTIVIINIDIVFHRAQLEDY